MVVTILSAIKGVEWRVKLTNTRNDIFLQNQFATKIFFMRDQLSFWGEERHMGITTTPTHLVATLGIVWCLCFFMILKLK